jgi:hypothetical protein
LWGLRISSVPVTYSSRQRLTRWTTWDHDGHRWHVGLTWARPDGQASRLVGFELWATPPGSDRVDLGPEESPLDEAMAHAMSQGWDNPAVTGRLLHDLPLRSIAAPARAEILDLLRALPAADSEPIRAVVECRQPRYPHGHYERVARLYLEADDEPVMAVCRAYPWAKRSTVGQWVYRCRHMLGLLPPYVP